MLMLSAIVAVAVSAFPAGGWAEEPAPDGAAVRAGILRAVDFMKGLQKPGGLWPDYAQDGGVTALVTYALLQAGVAPDDKGVAAALDALCQVPNQTTYVVSLKTLAFTSADPKRYAKEIQACADWLVQTQGATGAWGYGRAPDAPAMDPNFDRGRPSAREELERRRAFERPDASNTQFAILALSEADRAGARVPIDLWKRADRHFRTTQLPGGGWGYVYHDPDPAEAYGSMTAAALASLYLCADRLGKQETPDASAERLAAIDRGLEWITAHYTLSENPGRAQAWYYFWLYSLERTGVITGRRTFGDHDWFREGVALLVGGQRPDGSWSDPKIDAGRRLYQDALCLLFLAKGYKPMLVQRLEWEGAWRRDPRDLEHLTRYLDKRVGGELVAWQTVKCDAPLEQYLAAPLLHVCGHGPVQMIAGLTPRLKEYVEQGGLIVFDAEAGSKPFCDSVREILHELFPDAKLVPLASDHPLCSIVHKVPPQRLEILNTGCRAAVILAPEGLAERWAAADPAAPNEALMMGENIAAYATGTKPLPDRLATAALMQLPPDEPPPRAGWVVGQIEHEGDWNPRPFALPRLFKELAEQHGVVIMNRPVPVRLGQTDLAGKNILYLTGHYAFHLGDDEVTALKAYLERGGVLVAEACCGRAPFDVAMNDLVKKMFPDAALKDLPADHPIFRGAAGSPIGAVTYSSAVQAESPTLNRPVLKGVELNGHLVIVYSPYGLASGLDGMKTYGTRCLEPNDAHRLAVNIFLNVMMK
jgi:hypothetical protein